MKYLMLVPDGCGDWPIEALDGKTPLEAADIQNINALAKGSEIGLVRTVPEGFPPGSEANVTLLGYGPDAYQTGRAPLEAIAMGIPMADDDLAFRVNLITVAGDGSFEKRTIKDHSAGEISNEEARTLIEYLDSELGEGNLRFYEGVSYRCLMVSNQFQGSYSLTPPHDILDQEIGRYLPKGDGGERLTDLIQKSQALLKEHPINKDRIQKGLRPANSIWIWGYGKKPTLKPFSEKYGLNGCVITAVNLVKGYALCAGLSLVEVPGADGTLHTNYTGKGIAAIDAFEKGMDYVCVHVEAPDECSHSGDLNGKLEALRQIDQNICKPLKEYLHNTGEPYRILVVTDHKTTLKKRTHCEEPVPYLLFDSEKQLPFAEWKAFNETAGEQGGFFNSGGELADYFLRQ